MAVIQTSALCDFTNPVGILTECHRHIRSFIASLIEFYTEAEGNTLSEADRARLRSALSSIVTAAALHFADEELTLFSALSTPSSELKALFRAAEKEHRALSRAFEEIDRIGRRWIEYGILSQADSTTLMPLLEAIQVILQNHFQVEEEVMFPQIEALSTSAQLQAYGREMALRRGLRPDLNGNF